MTASQALIDEILETVDRLPEMPTVALQVNRMLDDPNVDAQGLAKVIMLDPGLTAQVLKLCNSAEFGFSRRIATISEAVSILGYNELKRIIYTIISHGLLSRPVEGYALDKGELWDNALTCGTFSRHIASRFNFHDPELAFLSAILRDIGKIILQNHIKSRATDLEIAAMENKFAFDDAEEQLIGVSHTEIGAKLAEKWNLPETLGQVIQFHHHPSAMDGTEDSDTARLVSIVHLADTFTMLAGIGIGIDGLMYPLDGVVFEHLSIDQSVSELETLYAELLDMRGEIQRMLSAF